MACLFQITVDPAFVTVQIPEKGYAWSKPNLVAYDLPSKRIIAVFESASEITQKLQANHRSPSEYVIRPALHPHDADAYVMMGVLEFLVVTTADKVGVWWSWMLGPTVIDYEWNISDYDQYSPDLKRQLEYTLQVSLGAGELSMNGTSVAIARWKRNLELWIRKLLPVGPFIGLFIGGYSIVVAPPLLTYPLSWLWIVGFGLIAVFMEPMWAIFTRNWLPHDYLRFLLESRGALSHLTRRLTLQLIS